MTMTRVVMGIMALCLTMPLPGFPGSGVDEKGGSEDGVQVILEYPRSAVYKGERFPVTLRITHPASLTLTRIKVSGLPADDQFRLSPFERIVSAGELEDAGESIYRSWAVPLQAGHQQFEPMVDYIAIERRVHDFFRVRHRETAGRIAASALTVEVNAWPLKGRPSEFQGAVGQFEMTTVIDSDEPVQPGSVLRLRTVVSGAGVLDGIPAPRFVESLPDYWRGYAVRLGEVKPTRREFERMVVPLQAGELVIPALVFAWWDPIHEVYASSTNGPFTVSVQPLPYDLPVYLPPRNAD